MGEIKPSGVFLSCDLSMLNGISPAVLEEYVRKIPGIRMVWISGEGLVPKPDAIQKEIKAHNLKRFVLAGYEPGMDKSAFSRALALAGEDPAEVSLASFSEYGVKGIDEAKAALYCAIHGIPYPEARMNGTAKVLPETVVIGGGIAGIQAALEIADSGNKVFLVERSGTIGGHMAMFDKTFPTLDCAACILTPKMVEVGQHPNIELLTLSEVTEVSGNPGNFEVTIHQKARYVDITACIGCGVCSDKCPQKTYSEFDAGTALRKAIYIPFPQAVPNKYLIDAESCRYIQEGKCGVCQKVCPAECIDFNDKDKEVKVNVGNIIVATGFQTFDPARIKEYGYGKYPNVLTSLEFERLINAAGPTGGNIRFRTQDKKGNWIFADDGGEPGKVALIHCIGSRDRNYHEYCSRVCCMYSLKLAHLVKEKLPDAEVYEYYIDMRAFGKGYEEFYDRIREEGVHMVRGRTAKIRGDNGKLQLRTEDILNNRLIEQQVDMVVLAVGLEPRDDAAKLANMLNIRSESSGWFLESCSSSDHCGSISAGIHLAGVCQGPKDIPDSVAQGSAAAARVLESILKGEINTGITGLHDIELRAKELATMQEDQ
ncbi:MAG: FAD-dependent oxidoreductase [Bacteroidales bacterium]|jgi:heterodisulfide reductase subunit A|nr:FAD-dependent oxidoreductase [Bacteroidales bacterium]